MTIPALIFSGLCVVAGTVVFIATRDTTVTMMLFGLGGASGTGVGILARRNEGRERERANNEQRRADHWQEQTQTMLRRDR